MAVNRSAACPSFPPTVFPSHRGVINSFRRNKSNGTKLKGNKRTETYGKEKEKTKGKDKRKGQKERTKGKDKRKRQKANKKETARYRTVGCTNTNEKLMKINAKKAINPFLRPVINIVPKSHQKRFNK
jgi:hypothetical protein